MLEVARNQLVVMGRPPTQPSLVGTDNSANLTIAMGAATPSRTKADLLKWAQLRDRIHRDVIRMGKVSTEKMPVDFMTKWLKWSKVDEQVGYLTNSRHAVWPD